MVPKRMPIVAAESRAMRTDQMLIGKSIDVKRRTESGSERPANDPTMPPEREMRSDSQRN